MKLTKLSFLFSISLVLASVLLAFGQSDFDNKNVEYTFTLPSDNWKMIVEPSDISPNVEFVYNYKKDGHLEIRKIEIEAKTLFGELIEKEEGSLLFLPSYVAGKEENFQGNYSGRIFNYEYASAGRAKGGRYYFLKTDDTTVYILKFTGLKDSLRSIRNETDSIARTFKIKEKTTKK